MGVASGAMSYLYRSLIVVDPRLHLDGDVEYDEVVRVTAADLESDEVVRVTAAAGGDGWWGRRLLYVHIRHHLKDYLVRFVVADGLYRPYAVDAVDTVDGLLYVVDWLMVTDHLLMHLDHLDHGATTTTTTSITSTTTSITT